MFEGEGGKEGGGGGPTQESPASDKTIRRTLSLWAYVPLSRADVRKEKLELRNNVKM